MTTKFALFFSVILVLNLGKGGLCEETSKLDPTPADKSTVLSTHADQLPVHPAEISSVATVSKVTVGAITDDKKIEPKLEDVHPSSLNDVSPKPGNWSIIDTPSGVVCIKLTSFIDFEVFYPQKNNKTGSVKISVPYNATESGSCNGVNSTQSIVLKFPLAPNLNSSSVHFTFQKNDNKSQYYLYAVDAVFYTNNQTFPNITDGLQFIKLEKTGVAEFSSPLNYSFLCNRESNFKLPVQNVANVTEAILKFNDLRLQAFGNDKEGKFGEANDCDSYITPDIVPIIVGCALALLVLVVLVAYLIGRRRSAARGYLSM